MTVTVRTINPEEFDRWRDVVAGVFAFEAKPEDGEVMRARSEPERTWGAYDGTVMVGTAGAFSYSMTVPGGATVPTGGLTAVTVAPTHRRRGVLTAMMRHYLEDCRDRGEAMAALWASESVIYGRYGFGVGVLRTDADITRAHTGLRVDAPSTGAVRAIDLEEARSIVPVLHAEAGAGVPGWIERRPSDWDEYFYDPKHWRDGWSGARFVVYERAGTAIGYLRYRVKAHWEDGHPRYSLTIGDLQALDGEAYAGLFRFAFGVDLVDKFEMYNRRVREPLTALLAEPRRLQRHIRDSIWMRPVDVAAALAARRYAVAGDLVIEVRDDVCPWVEGRYRLVGGPETAECTPTDAEADVVVAAADLGASYLGDVRFASRAWSGMMDGAPEAVVHAHRMFGWHIDPWCTTYF